MNCYQLIKILRQSIAQVPISRKSPFIDKARIERTFAEPDFKPIIASTTLISIIGKTYRPTKNPPMRDIQARTSDMIAKIRAVSPGSLIFCVILNRLLSIDLFIIQENQKIIKKI